MMAEPATADGAYLSIDPQSSHQERRDSVPSELSDDGSVPDGSQVGKGSDRDSSHERTACVDTGPADANPASYLDVHPDSDTDDEGDDGDDIDEEDDFASAVEDVQLSDMASNTTSNDEFRTRLGSGLTGEEISERLNSNMKKGKGSHNYGILDTPKNAYGILSKSIGTFSQKFRTSSGPGTGMLAADGKTPNCAEWSDDWNASNCLLCAKPFVKPIVKKHNCFACGRAICGACSRQRLPRYQHFRVCQQCYVANLYSSKVKISFRPTPGAVTIATLCKRGHLNKGWKQRLFILDSNGSMTYFRQKGKEAGVIPSNNVIRWISREEETKLKDLKPAQIKWPSFCSDGQFGFQLCCLSRDYFLCAYSMESLTAWKQLISLAAMLCWRCGRQCFQSDYSGSDPKCIFLSEVNRLYHPECFRCEICESLSDPPKTDMFKEAYFDESKLCCSAHVSEDVMCLTQKGVMKKDCRAQCEHELRELSNEFARNAAEAEPTGVKCIATGRDSPKQNDSEPTSPKTRERSRSWNSNKMKERKDRIFANLMKCLMTGIKQATQEEDIDSQVMSPELGGRLYRDGQGKAILEEVTANKITPEEAIKKAKLEAYKLSEEAEQNLEGFKPNSRPLFEILDEEEGAREFEFTSYAPCTFGRIRTASGFSPSDYCKSFEQLPGGDLAGGASGSFVKKSHDGCLIIKSIDKGEIEVLMRVLRAYLTHLESAPHSLLVRFLGLYDVKLDGKSMSVVIMKNVHGNISDLTIDELYDLKGSHDHRRTKGSKNKFNAVESVSLKVETQKDMDLERPLIIGPRGKLILNMQIGEDVQFLNSEGLMDYSLLVGIHNCPGESCPECKDRRKTEVGEDGKVRSQDIYRCGIRGGGLPHNPNIPESVYAFGIIDLLQVWNSKKTIEAAAKAKILRRDEHSISAVKPDEYAVRFHEMLTQRLEE